MADDGMFYPYPRIEVEGAAHPAAAPAEGAAEHAAALAEEAPPAPPWGICFSGGGIRAASFSLGVAQAMHDHHMLHGPGRATYLSAVSGGSYMAGGLALVARGAFPDEDAPPGHQIVTPTLGEPPFGRGSPEERLLRDRTQYLTHGRGGRAAMLWRLLMGISVNLLLAGLTLHAVARPLGWLYGGWLPRLRVAARPALKACEGAAAATGCTEAALKPLPLPHWILATAGWLAVAGVVFGLAWVTVRWRRPGVAGGLAGTSFALLAASALLLVAGVVIPHLLEFIRISLPRHGVGTKPTGTMATSRRLFSQETRTLALGTATTVAGTALTGGMAFRAANAGAPVVARAEKAVRNAATSLWQRLSHKYREPLLNLAAAVFGPLLLASTFLLFLAYGAGSPPGTDSVSTARQLAWWLIPLALLGLILWLGDLTAWSLHPFYKQRLAAAFALRRITPPLIDGSPTAVGDIDAQERPFGCRYCLSQSQPDDFPELLICAAANVTDYGATPTGSNVTSFVFSAKEVGGPLVHALDTSVYEHRAQNRGRDLTLPTAVAIAGAAVAPSMGKMTRPPLRFLMALLDIRLGVWLPNPRKVAELTPRADGTFRYPSRPRPDYLLRELFGRNRLDARYLYVTDGGHYENLGLVELIRRRCRWIWCVDGAGDSIDTFNTLGEALALARSELGVTTAITPEADMAPDPEVSAARAKLGKPPFAKRAFCHGVLTYPDGTTGDLVVIKAGVPADAPWDVQSFYERHHQFPCDPTANQLYTAERFDAYRALGTYAMQSAWDVHGAGFEAFRSPTQTPTP